jgi:hypothetical protein
MKLMEELFTCPICKLSFGHKARLRAYKSIRNPLKRIAKANSTKKAEHEKMLIQERIARTGSALKMNRREISTLKEGVGFVE